MVNDVLHENLNWTRKKIELKYDSVKFQWAYDGPYRAWVFGIFVNRKRCDAVPMQQAGTAVNGKTLLIGL